jgi:Sensory domain in DIguanylate Cyclases and Two-component system
VRTEQIGAPGRSAVTPYALVSGVERPAAADKATLLAVTRKLERQALLNPPGHVAAALQDQRFLTPRTRDVYAALARSGVQARLHARGLQSWLAPGVAGVALTDDDPLVDEWVVVLPCAASPVVLAATDGGTLEEGDGRSFSYALSHDPELVAACGVLLGLPSA